MGADIEIYNLPKTPGSLRKFLGGVKVLDRGEAAVFLRRVEGICISGEEWQLLGRDGGGQVVFEHGDNIGSQVQLLGRYIVLNDNTRTNVERGLAMALCNVLDNAFRRDAVGGTVGSRITNSASTWEGLVGEVAGLTGPVGDVRVIAPVGLARFLERYTKNE